MQEIVISMELGKLPLRQSPSPRFKVVISNFTPTLICGQGRHNIDLGGGGCVTTLLSKIVGLFGLGLGLGLSLELRFKD